MWARVLLIAPDDGVLGTWPLSGVDPPDLATVDLLARLHLSARRMGCTLAIEEACAELAGLLDLAGLADVVPIRDGSPSPDR